MCCLLFAGCMWLIVVCSVLDVCVGLCVLAVVCCLLLVDYYVLHVACCMMFVVC